MQAIMDQVKPLPVSYDKLSSLTRREWQAEMKKWGISLEEGEEDPVAKDVLVKIHKKKKAKAKKNASKLTASKPVCRHGHPVGKEKEIIWGTVESTANNSSASEFKWSKGSSNGEYQARVEDIPPTIQKTQRDTNKSHTFEGPFTMVINSNKSRETDL